MFNFFSSLRGKQITFYQLTLFFSNDVHVHAFISLSSLPVSFPYSPFFSLLLHPFLTHSLLINPTLPASLIPLLSPTHSSSFAPKSVIKTRFPTLNESLSEPASGKYIPGGARPRRCQTGRQLNGWEGRKGHTPTPPPSLTGREALCSSPAEP